MLVVAVSMSILGVSFVVRLKDVEIAILILK